MPSRSPGTPPAWAPHPAEQTNTPGRLSASFISRSEPEAFGGAHVYTVLKLSSLPFPESEKTHPGGPGLRDKRRPRWGPGPWAAPDCCLPACPPHHPRPPALQLLWTPEAGDKLEASGKGGVKAEEAQRVNGQAVPPSIQRTERPPSPTGGQAGSVRLWEPRLEASQTRAREPPLSISPPHTAG